MLALKKKAKQCDDWTKKHALVLDKVSVLIKRKI